MLALVCAVLLEDPVLPTKLDLTADQKWSDDVRLTYSQPDDDFEMTYVDRWNWTVGLVDAEGNVFFRRQRQNLETLMNGQKLPGGDSGWISLTLTKRGALKQFEETAVDPEVEHRLARVLAISLPENDQVANWTRKYPAATEGKIPAMEVSFTRDKGRDLTYTVTEVGGKHPMTGKGKATLDANGTPLRLELKLKNALIPGGDGEPAELTVLLTRVPEKGAKG